MALRSIWNGSISFGMVRVPVKLYSATASKTIRFREVHLKDESPLEHRRISTATDEEVPWSGIVKGYETGDGEYVVLEPDEVKAAAGDRGKVIELSEFVDAAEIDPTAIRRTYYAGYRDRSEAWSVLRDALEQTGKAGIGRFTFHNREQLVAVRAEGPVIAVEVLRFADELIPATELGIDAAPEKLTPKEKKMAKRLIEGLYEEFDPEEWQDEHRDQVLAVIRAKAEGEKPKKQKGKARRANRDLAAALEASLEQVSA